MILRDRPDPVEKLEQEIINKYPYMFELMKVESPHYPIRYGFACDDGWIPLLEILFKGIAELDTEKAVRIFQIKEKFGGLRFYIEFDTKVEYSKAIYNLINKAEEASYNICERCGATPAKQTSKGWIKTLCSKCSGEKDEEQDGTSQ